MHGFMHWFMMVVLGAVLSGSWLIWSQGLRSAFVKPEAAEAAKDQAATARRKQRSDRLRAEADEHAAPASIRPWSVRFFCR